MATSTIPAAKAAIVSAIAARPALAGVQVTWGVPHVALEPEWILVGDVIESRQESAAVGQQRRDEFFTVEVIVSVVKAGVESPQSVAERAFALVAEIELALRPLSQPPIGVAGLIWALIEKTDLSERFDSQKREAQVTVHVGCRARI